MAEDTKRQVSQRRHMDSVTPKFFEDSPERYCTHCWYCGVQLYQYFKIKKDGRKVGVRKHYTDKATKDHLIPYSKGGRGSKNLVPACGDCNSHKGDRTLEEYRLQRFGTREGLFWAEKYEQNYRRREVRVPTNQSSMVSKDSSSGQRTVGTDSGRVDEAPRENFEV